MRVVIVGGGTMGLAVAWALSRRGIRATVLERFEHIHDRGSHGGLTRAIRHAYHEGSDYVRLVQRADDLWVELGARRSETLLVRSGLLEFGPPDHPGYREALAAIEEHDLEHERCSAAEARRRWPFELPDEWTACFTPSGGYLRVESCLDALRDEARDGGARFEYGTAVISLELDIPAVVLADGRRVHADAIVVTAGVGLPELLPDVLPGQLHRLRRVLAWRRPALTSATLRALPVWGAFLPEGFFYGFPPDSDAVGGLKLACHFSDTLQGMNDPIDPERLDRTICAADLAPLERFTQRHFPVATGPWIEQRVCMYTTTPSWNFIVDRHPRAPSVIVAGGFSGHGFKFAPAIGESVAGLVSGERVALPEMFSWATHHRSPVEQ